MVFWNRKSATVDRISSEALANFGRYEFLGSQQSGIDPSDSYSLISELNELIFTSTSADRDLAVAELHRHAAKGEWERVGAWKYVREFLDDEADTRDLIDGGLLAIAQMRVTNLSIHLAPIDAPRYAELTGGPPPNDGFFGPPVFDSNFGPTRQYYFDDAIARAAARRVTRLKSATGLAPGHLEDAARSMWDFGLLVYRGPLVINPDITFEPNVVRPAVAAATGVDHSMFADHLAHTLLDSNTHGYEGLWSFLGGTRFIEEYLDLSAVDASGYSRLLDAGVELLVTSGAIGVTMAPEILTQRQRVRLQALSSEQ